MKTFKAAHVVLSQVQLEGIECETIQIYLNNYTIFSTNIYSNIRSYLIFWCEYILIFSRMSHSGRELSEKMLPMRDVRTDMGR